MRVTILQNDGAVIVDGVSHSVDCSELPAFIRAIQWDSGSDRGHIEFDPDERGVRMGNLPITSLEPFQFLVERWRIASTLQARAERQARVDEVVQEIASRKEHRAHVAAMQAAADRVADEQRRANELAQNERNRAAQVEAELVEIKARLTEMEQKRGKMK